MPARWAAIALQTSDPVHLSWRDAALQLTSTDCIAITRIVTDTLSVAPGPCLGPGSTAPMLRWTPAAERIAWDMLSTRPIHIDAARLALAELTLSGAATTDGKITETIAAQATLRFPSARPFLVPLRVQLALTGGPAAYSASGTAFDANGALAVTLDASGLPAAGQATVSLAPLVFIPGVRSPADLAPMLGSVTGAMDGMVWGEAAVSWQGAEVAASARMDIDAREFEVAGLILRGLQGFVSLDRVQPLSGQVRATASDLVAGIVAQMPELAAALTPKGVRLETASAELADGRISVANAFIPWSGPDSVAATLVVEDLDLAQLFPLVGVEGLAGTGRVSGRLPVSLGDQGLSLETGELLATGGGRLSYDPANPPAFLEGQDQRSEWLRTALQNLLYERLVLRLDGAHRPCR